MVLSKILILQLNKTKLILFDDCSNNSNYVGCEFLILIVVNYQYESNFLKYKYIYQCRFVPFDLIKNVEIKKVFQFFYKQIKNKTFIFCFFVFYYVYVVF